MLLRFMNFFVGLFGYEWVKVDNPYKNLVNESVADEGWDDLDENAPHYKLRKK